ncbi:MAG: hypothetical protein WB615_02610 [Candidatus Tumulicola sp.]
MIQPFSRCATLCIVVALTACNAIAPGSNPNMALGQPAMPSNLDAGRPVTQFRVKGRQIEMTTIRGAAPAKREIMFIKGVDYGPTPICSTTLDNPLGNSNRAIWRRDLPQFRALNINAIKVYNANPNAEPLSNFLDQAYNNGKRPIYVILSIFFPGKAMLNQGAVNDLAGQYRKLAQDNGAYPAVIGMSIGSEVNAEDLIKNPDWWKGMSTLARAAKEGFRLAGQPEKLITTTMVDDGMNTVRAGEQNNFPVDAWGINAYKGAKFGDLWSTYEAASKKPFIVSEYGTPVGFHPNDNPYKAKEFPPRSVHLVTDYIGGLAEQMYQHSTLNGGPNSGGFYFEFNDEWWKGGDDCIQLTSPHAPDPKFVGGFDDEAWFGLNIISEGNPNVLTPRPAFSTLQEIWANQ